MTEMHALLETGYGEDGLERLRAGLVAGFDLASRVEGETLLHVATRRRRLDACAALLDAGVDVDARNAGGKSAYAHAVRRGFEEIGGLLAERGAETTLAAADELAVALGSDRLADARALLRTRPDLARTSNGEEDRLLADLAGRAGVERITLLIEAGADLTAPGLDGGTPLHQAAWFGQPENARALVDAGAPLDVFDPVHASSPIGWAAHGSRFSGDAAAREAAYVDIVRLLLIAGSSLRYPGDSSDGYLRRLAQDASPAVAALLPERP